MADINDNVGLNNEEVVSLTKKGTVRKRKPKKSQIYFTQETEDAILEYVASDDPIFRNKIFNEKINYPFHKLAENIIHTFKFYYTEVNNIQELKHEVVTFLLGKLHLYQKELGKAYSYFGTITKRWLILYNNTNYKKLKNKAQVNEVDTDNTIYNNIVLESTNKELELNTFIEQFVRYIDNNLFIIFPKKIEAKVADSILEVLRHRENIDIPFNKKALYIVVRGMTDVATPHITKVIKKLKKYYITLYNEYYRNGFISEN